MNSNLINDYRSFGYARLSNLEEVTRKALCLSEGILQGSTERFLPETLVKNLDGSLRSIFGIHRQSVEAAEIARNEQIRELANNLIGGPSYLFQSQINTKPPGIGGNFAPHRDIHYFHNRDGVPSPNLMLGLALNLVKVSDKMGPLKMWAGSHTSYEPLEHSFGFSGETSLIHARGLVDYGLISAEEHSRYSNNQEESFTGDVGSMLVFDPRIIHWSDDNMLQNQRHMLLLFFNAVSNKPLINSSPWFLSETNYDY